MFNVSIIVPVYKTQENYFRKCINSLISQTMKEIEIILIDDGSPDNCGSICDEYAERDNRIRVIHQKNGGMVSAIATGIRATTSEYIGFVDSDDWIEQDMFEKMLGIANQYQTDIICCGLIEEMSGCLFARGSSVGNGYFGRHDIETKIFPRFLYDPACADVGLDPNRWTKLFRTELVKNNYTFTEKLIGNSAYGEDVILTFSALCDAKSIFIMNNFTPYHYIRNSASMTCKKNLRLWDQIQVLNLALKCVSSKKNVYNFSNQISWYLIGQIYHDIKSNEIYLGTRKEVCTRLNEIRDSLAFKGSIKSVKIRRLPIHKRYIILFLKTGNYNPTYFTAVFVECVDRMRKYILSMNPRK